VINLIQKCACGEATDGCQGMGDGYAESHTATRCEFEEYRTLRWRFFRWLGSAIDDLRGPCRTQPSIRVVTCTTQDESDAAAPRE
jgi:hypothetical protein